MFKTFLVAALIEASLEYLEVMMEDLKKEIMTAIATLETLYTKLAVRANCFRNFPNYEKGDKLDRSAIYTQAARIKLHKARQELC